MTEQTTTTTGDTFKTTIPKSRSDITIAWFNSFLNGHNLSAQSFEFLGSGKINNRGALSSLEKIRLVLSDNSLLNIIIKTLPENKGLRDYVVNSGFISREVSMINTVFPLIENSKSSMGFRRPICYFCGEEGEGDNYQMVVVLENMIESGYTQWEHGPGKNLDIEKIRAVVKVLAQFHSLSIAYGLQNNIKNFRQLFPFLLDQSKSDENIGGYIEAGFNVIYSLLQDEESYELKTPQGLIEHLKKVAECLPDLIRTRLFTKDFGFSCIRHNDIHTANIFFKETESGIEAALIDFQACLNDNPINDLCFFILLSTDWETAWGNIDEILILYHSHLTDALLSLGCENEVLPLEKIKKFYEDGIFTNLMHILTGAPTWCNGPESTKISRERIRTALIESFKHGLLNIPND